jgi:hypothetical protein
VKGSAPQQQRILQQVRCFPGVPVKLLYRQWKQSDATLPALSAVYRWLEHNDLDVQGRRDLLRPNLPGPTRAFEASGVTEESAGWATLDVDRERLAPSLPTQTGQAVLPHPAFQFGFFSQTSG